MCEFKGLPSSKKKRIAFFYIYNRKKYMFPFFKSTTGFLISINRLKNQHPVSTQIYKIFDLL